MQAEDILQINLMNWFTHNYPQYKDDIYHIALQRRCSVTEGRLLKRMGVKKGMSDLFIPLTRNGRHGLWLELKTLKGKLSKEQMEFLARQTANGYMAVCTYGLEAAQEIIKAYLDEDDFTHGKPIC